MAVHPPALAPGAPPMSPLGRMMASPSWGSAMQSGANLTAGRQGRPGVNPSKIYNDIVTQRAQVAQAKRNQADLAAYREEQTRVAAERNAQQKAYQEGLLADSTARNAMTASRNAAEVAERKEKQGNLIQERSMGFSRWIDEGRTGFTDPLTGQITYYNPRATEANKATLASLQDEAGAQGGPGQPGPGPGQPGQPGPGPGQPGQPGPSPGQPVPVQTSVGPGTVPGATPPPVESDATTPPVPSLRGNALLQEQEARAQHNTEWLARSKGVDLENQNDRIYQNLLRGEDMNLGMIEGTVQQLGGALFNTDASRRTKELERYHNQMTLGNAQSLSGQMSDKDIKFLQGILPSITDSEEAWKDYFWEVQKRREAHKIVLDERQEVLANGGLLRDYNEQSRRNQIMNNMETNRQKYENEIAGTRVLPGSTGDEARRRAQIVVGRPF